MGLIALYQCSKLSWILLLFIVWASANCQDCQRRAQDSSFQTGAFVPQCDAYGNFAAEQCHSSIGVCWCSTENGVEIPGTRVTAGTLRRQRCADERIRSNSIAQPVIAENRFIAQNGPSSGVLGQCPQVMTYGICISYCTTDADCVNTNRKCCSNGCGKQCMTPVVTTANIVPEDKPGTCPTNINRSGMSKGDECLTDSQCFANQKCCHTSIGTKCLPPDSGSFTPIPVPLPVPVPVPVPEKAGLCPKETSTSKQFARILKNDRCQKDTECPGQLKCCDTNIGKACLDIFSLAVTEDQQGQCIDFNEEYRSCGETCPRACDNLSQPVPNYCNSAECVIGCFCKAGYYRLSSRDPKSSCVPQAQCFYIAGSNPQLANPQQALSSSALLPSLGNINLQPGSSSFIAGSTSSSLLNGGFNGFPSGSSILAGGSLAGSNGLIAGSGNLPSIANQQSLGPIVFQPKSGLCPSGQIHPSVAQTILNGLAKPCASDIGCSGEQKCCAPPPPLASVSFRCLCTDPNSFWKECATTTPETCDNPQQTSLLQCSPGCVCVDGFIKQSASPGSLCVFRSQCPSAEPELQRPDPFPVTPLTSTSRFARATAKLSSNFNVDGILNFEQNGNNVLITGTIRGLQNGQHGVHIHTSGDISNGCNSVGAHYNPDNQDHGSPLSAIRHAGDLGNINTDINGFTSVKITDNRISLNGPNSIIGRSLVIHENQDDYGQGTSRDSKQSGNAGQPLACGVIGV